MMLLKKGTSVKVISGKDKGKTGEILEIDRKERRLRKKKRQMESSGSAEKKEEAKKEQRTLETVATGTRGGGGIR